MSCGFCLKKYEPYGVDCAYCERNPRNEKLTDNFEACYIGLTNKDFEVDSVNLDPNSEWEWDIFQDEAYNQDVFDLKIYATKGVILTRKVTIQNGRWTDEKRKIIAERFKLPLNKLIPK